MLVLFAAPTANLCGHRRVLAVDSGQDGNRRDNRTVLRQPYASFVLDEAVIFVEQAMTVNVVHGVSPA